MFRRHLPWLIFPPPVLLCFLVAQDDSSRNLVRTSSSLPPSPNPRGSEQFVYFGEVPKWVKKSFQNQPAWPRAHTSPIVLVPPPRRLLGLAAPLSSHARVVLPSPFYTGQSAHGGTPPRFAPLVNIPFPPDTIVPSFWPILHPATTPLRPGGRRLESSFAPQLASHLPLNGS